MVLETAMLIPILLLLIVGMVQIGKVTYQYYTLKKMVFAAGRQLAVQQGVNFCDIPNDAIAQAAINFALNDSSGTPIVPEVTTLNVSAECADANGVLAPCTSCPDNNPQPGYLLVTIPDGFQVQVRIPFISPIPITLNPYALVPFGGVS
jgi:Flp pilus assembly protein TadG